MAPLKALPLSNRQSRYRPRPRLRVLQETFRVSDYAIKGVKARGVRLASKEVKSARYIEG